MAMPLSRRKIYLVLIFSQLSQKNGQKSFEPIALIPPIAKQSVGGDHYAKKIYCSKLEKYFFLPRWPSPTDINTNSLRRPSIARLT